MKADARTFATRDELRAAQWLLAEIDALYARDAQTGPEAWWRGTCDSVLATAEAEGLLERYGARAVWWGAFAGPSNAGHCWLVLGETIVDPTACQFGVGQPRIIRPGESWYAHYVEREAAV